MSIFKLYRFGFICTFIMLLFTFLVSEKLQDVIGMILILCIGILHGANDLKIIQKFGKTKPKKSFAYFVLYVGVVFLGGLLFYSYPQAALPLFVLVSAFHFGEQHWETRSPTILYRSFFFLLYGIFIFSLLFYIQAETSAQIIEQIVGIALPTEFWIYSTAISGLTVLLLLILSKLNRKFIVWELVHSGLLFLVFFKGSLILAFATYFVFWHSLPSLRSQIQYLYDSNTREAWIQYIKSGLLYWLLALTSLVIAYQFIDLSKTYFLSLFFIFLAAITFPHALVMELMFRKKE